MRVPPAPALPSGRNSPGKFLSSPIAPLPCECSPFAGSIAAIAAIRWFVSRFAGQRAALVTAFIAAVHPYLITHSPEMRGYPSSLLVALLVLSVSPPLLSRCATVAGSTVGLGASAFVMLSASERLSRAFPAPGFRHPPRVPADRAEIRFAARAGRDLWRPSSAW
ncbi:MAG: hypothetical protein H7A53_03665 [Akkermansiaceae bacterium]|nr:hypothetical protein [Akkermansiaceae bacterium]